MKFRLDSILLAVATVTPSMAGLIGNDFTNGLIYDVDVATGAATNARGGTPNLVGVAYASGGALFGLTTGGGSLYRIDPVTGIATLVGTTGLSDITEGDLAFDPTSGVLYGLQESNPRNLFTLNLSTGAGTVIGSVGTTNDLSAMAFDTAGNLFVLNTQAGSLLTLNKSTGAVLTSVSLSIALGNTAGMAFNPANGLLYVADGNDFGTDSLYTLNTSTGSLTLIGATGLARGLAGLTFELPRSHDVPEPSSAMTLLIGVTAALFFGRRKEMKRMAAKFLIPVACLCAAAAWGQTASVSNRLAGPAMGGSVGQIMRISVAADPSVRCLAVAGFRTSDAQPPDPDKTLDLLPGQAGFAEINMGKVATRIGVRSELVPAVKVLDGKCSAVVEVFDSYSGRVSAHVRLLATPPEPDLPAISVAAGMMVRFGVTRATDPPDPDKTCSAVLGFFDARGAAVGPTKTVNLLPGQFDFIELNPNSLIGVSGPRIVQPRLLLPAVRVGDAGHVRGCMALAQVYDSLSGWNMEAVSAK